MKRRSRDSGVIYIENDVSEQAIKNAFQQKRARYGITKEKFLELAEKNNYSCQVCGDSAEDAVHTLCVDHDYYTNEIRGLLCSGCNAAAGWLEDNPEKAEKLAHYLRHAGTGLFVPENTWTRYPS